MNKTDDCKRYRVGPGFAVVLTAAVIVLTWVVALPRVFRHHRDTMLSLAPFRRFLIAYNTLTRGISGTTHSSWGLLAHVGRSSGRRYQTSLGTAAFGDGFLLPLGYGTRSDWYRNVVAAGQCELTWKGRTYQLSRPELISGPEAQQAWPLRDRILLRLAGMHDFVWLHRGGQREMPVTGTASSTGSAPSAAKS